MIDLVLQAAREQAVGLDLELLAVEVHRANANLGRAFDVAVDVGNRQAAFFALVLPFGVNDFGIDDDERIVVDVDDGEPFGASDLRRGEADALRQVHRLEHVARQRPQLVGDFGDGLGILAENRVAEDADVENAHASSEVVTAGAALASSCR